MEMRLCELERAFEERPPKGVEAEVERLATEAAEEIRLLREQQQELSTLRGHGAAGAEAVAGEVPPELVAQIAELQSSCEDLAQRYAAELERKAAAPPALETPMQLMKAPSAMELDGLEDEAARLSRELAEGLELVAKRQAQLLDQVKGSNSAPDLEKKVADLQARLEEELRELTIHKNQYGNTAGNILATAVSSRTSLEAQVDDLSVQVAEELRSLCENQQQMMVAQGSISELSEEVKGCKAATAECKRCIEQLRKCSPGAPSETALASPRNRFPSRERTSPTLQDPDVEDLEDVEDPQNRGRPGAENMSLASVQAASTPVSASPSKCEVGPLSLASVTSPDASALSLGLPMGADTHTRSSPPPPRAVTQQGISDDESIEEENFSDMSTEGPDST
jgi:hypothetical protein